MRKRYALLGLVPFGILAACEEESSNGGIVPGPDGGQVVIDGAAQPAPEASVPDAGPLPVNVVVTRAGAPEGNVPVVFHDAAGVVIASVVTSAAGVATQLVPAGSQVTVIMGTPEAPHLLTITEVEPGDTLTAVDAPATEGGQVSVTALPTGAPPNSNFFASAGRCSGNIGNAPPLDLYVAPECQLAGTFPVFVTARDVESGEETGFTFKKDNKVGAPDGGGLPPVQVSAPWSTAFRTHTITVTNVPPAKSVETAFSEVASGVAKPRTEYIYNESPDAGTFQTQSPGHPGFPDFVQSEIERHDYYGQGMGVTAIATREASPAGAATTTFDFTALLPLVAEATLDGTTRDRPSITWKAEEGKAFDGADGAYVLIRWYVAENGTERNGEWTFVTPASRTTVKAPQLPTELTKFGPPADVDAGAVEVAFLEPAIVTLVEGTAIAGYGDFRKISASVPAAAALRWSSSGGVFIPPLPVDGTLRATAYTRNND